MAPFTSQDTINLNSQAATTDRKDDDISLIVHADDDTQFDLDNDLLGTPARTDSEKNGSADDKPTESATSGDAKTKEGEAAKSEAAAGDAKAGDAKPDQTSTDADAAAKSGSGADAKKTEEKSGKSQESKDASKTTSAAKRLVCICQ